MFTLKQIKEAHSKVKSGADFPRYVQDLIKLGITSYEIHVTDGHAEYKGKNDYKIFSEPEHALLPIAEKSHPEQLKSDLKMHQQGKTDYPTFCQDCAQAGIEKWAVNTEKMTCTYFEKAGNEILVERIPS